tara:strand:+ start:700 stop:1074 length:375 start_codon:yes stop_codon:yes gene_type:complete
MIHQFAEPKEKYTWVEIDIITGIIQNTDTKEKYTLGESPRTYRAPGPLPKFYRWCKARMNSGGGADPSEYSLCLTEDGESRLRLVVQLVNLDPKRWPTVDVLKNISVEELQAMYETMEEEARLE